MEDGWSNFGLPVSIRTVLDPRQGHGRLGRVDYFSLRSPMGDMVEILTQGRVIVLKINSRHATDKKRLYSPSFWIIDLNSS